MRNFSFKNVKVELKRQLNPSSLKKQFLETIKGIKKKDVVLMLILPILLTLIMVLPLSMRNLLQLDIKNPILWQYLTQSFVHNSWSHLSSNLFGYFLYSSLLLIWINKLKLKKEFYALFLFLIISLPIVSSFIQVKSYPILLSWLPNLQHSAGTSGIVSALAGFVIIFWAMYFNKINQKIVFDVRTSLSCAIFVALLFVFYYSQGISYLVIFVFGLFLIFLLTLIFNIKNIFIEISKESKRNFLFTFLLIVTPILFFVTPKIIFPTFNVMFKNGTFTDFFMHYVGIAYGIIISSSYFIFINKKWRD
ncbi:rhomboid family intramembrane serine protease [Candidatus Pacearchaeota archaeon]|nr:rhomboid family intramembrane serine protease [Candidatus Pacearchaeota archaeon]